MKPYLPILAALAAGLAGCESIEAQRTGETPQVASTPDAPLYARDGSVVAVPPRGSTRVENEPKRDIGENEGSRTTLLELYQKSMEAKNAANVQVENLQAALADQQKLAAQAAEERALLRAEITKLTQERDAARAEALDLAGRLTTAQIARLEAEKSLLEVQIANRQREDAAAAAEAASSSNERDDRSPRRRASEARREAPARVPDPHDEDTGGH